jgi:uncharacterized protein involved in response to NO
MPSLALSLPLLGESKEVSVWRREPYRVLFPAGALFAVVGTLPWVLFAAGALAGYPRVFHALVQVQSFLACFIGGFLFTFVPRRTGGPPPSRAELALAVAFPALLALGAGAGKIALAELAWLAWLVLVARFVWKRLVNAPMSPVPAPSMAWIPMSLGIGLFGTLVAAVAAIRGQMAIHDVGQRLALQALVAGLVMGVGGLLLPVLTRRSAAGAQRLPRAVHVVSALVFWASYPLELYSVRGAFAVRAGVTGLVLVYGASLWRLPEQRGLHVWLAWLGAWALPVGHLSVAIFPDHRVAGLHLVFLGSFAALVFAVGAHVTWSHGNRPELMRAPVVKSRLLPCAIALLVAVVARAGLDASGLHYFRALGLAGVAFVAAVACWLWAVAPVMWSKPFRHG